MKWTKEHIKSWLAWCAKKFSLQPAPDPEKFPSTGAVLCNLSTNEFEKMAECPRTGMILAKYIAHLRHSVTGRASSPLNVQCKVFEEPKGDEEEQGKRISFLIHFHL